MTGYGTRAAHLAWAKERALAYADAGDAVLALASIGSDLDKHPETAGHPAVQLMSMLVRGGQMQRPAEIREFIEGFN